MSATDSPFYVSGGTLRHDAPSYVERRADKELLEGLLAGEFCYVLTSRQMGKSSLMVRTAGKLREQRARVVVLDLTAIGQNLTPEQWYDGLLMRMGRQLDLEDELEDWWQDHPQLGPCQRFFTALKDVVLAGANPHPPSGHPLPSDGRGQGEGPEGSRGRLVLFVDEIDVVRSLPFSTDEFFAAIRECYNRRVEDAAFEQLTFCLLGVATPSDLIRDTRLTPFNIGRRIELNDFTAAEAAPLASGLNVERSTLDVQRSMNAQALLERILHWTSGHPYLTQRLCQAVAEVSSRREVEADLPLPSTGRGTEGDGWDDPKALSAPQPRPDSPLTPALSPLRGEGDGQRRRAANALRITSTAAEKVDELCEELFFSARAREQDDNLLFVRERLLRADVDRASLLHLYGQVVMRRRVPDDETNPLVSVLRLSGVTRIREGRLDLRNRVYARVFDRAWIRANMPDAEVRRQKVAFWRGVARTSAVGVVILAVVSALAVYANRQKRLAEARLYVADMEVAQQAVDAGNLGRARELVAAHRQERSALRGFEWRYLWKLSRGDQEFILGKHEDQVGSVRISPDGRTLATRSSGDRVLKVWDLASRECRLVGLDARSDTTDPVFTPDGKSLLLGGHPDVGAMDLSTGQIVSLLPGAGALVRLLDDGRTLVTSDTNYLVRYWDLSTREEGLRIPGRGGRVSGGPKGAVACVTGNGQRAYTFKQAQAGEEGGITVWDVPAQRPVAFLPDRRRFWIMRLSPDERRLAVGSTDGTLTVWDLQSTNDPPVIQAHQTVSVLQDVAFSPDSRILATCGSDLTIRVWVLGDEPRPLATLRGHESSVTALCFTPDGTQMVSGGRDRTIRVWQAGRARDSDGAPRVFDSDYSESPLFFLPDNKTVVGSSTNGVKLWDLERMQTRVTLPGSGYAWAVAGGRVYGPDTNTAGDPVIRAWDLQTRALVKEWPRAGMLPAVTEFASAPDAGIFVLGDRQGVLQFWETSGWRELRRFTNHVRSIWSLLFSRDGATLFSGGNDGTVRIWNMNALQETAVLSLTTRPVHGLALSPDERVLAVAIQEPRIDLWDWRARKRLATLTGHRQSVRSAGFSPDGRTLVSGSYDGAVKLWNVALRREVATLKLELNGVPIQERIEYVGFSPDGNLLTARTEQGTLKVWRAASWDEIAATEIKETASK